MKKIIREVISSIQKNTSGVIVLPGLNVDILSKIFESISGKYLLISKRNGIDVLRNYVDVSSKPLKGYTKYIIDTAHFFPEYANKDGYILITESPTRDIINSNILRIYHSENLIKKKYLEPFRIIRYTPNKLLSQHKGYNNRVEVLKDISIKYPNATILASNSIENGELQKEGISSVLDMNDINTNNVILSRELESIPGYLFLRNKLWGGTLIDLTDTTEKFENWEKIRLGELGFYNANKYDFEGYESFNLEQVKNFTLKYDGESIIKPRSNIPSLIIKDRKLFLKEKNLGEFDTKSRKVIIKINCRSIQTFALSKLSLSPFISPLSTGRCSLLMACVEVFQDKDLCTRVAFEGFLKIRDYISNLYSSNIGKILSSIVTRKLIVDITKSKRILSINISGKNIVLELNRNGNYITISCDSCSKKTKIRIRGDINSTRYILINSLYDIIKNEI
ncbi:hypothetical protein [Acidianus brierleyi]|uniref:Uncharacterized protein n=1 Tax=Acidianus brierleyi TaxID=41673 RepID=A0A2U9IBZ3_9CREN|nr:hypothetical protein [Acidianus brierleyi]AWR93510.1 hypothetical protein DFR85_01670 [Acidianus brierleyi]